MTIEINIPSGSPKVINLGTKEESTRQVSRVAVPTPQHCPYFLGYAPSGPAQETFGSSSDLASIFGTEIYNVRSAYANPGTVYMEAAARAANSHVFKRIIPENAKKAFLTVYLDLIADTVDNYQRDSDGNIVYEAGVPVEHPTVPTLAGFRAKLMIDSVEVASGNPFHPTGVVANNTTHPGTMTVGPVTSTRYPLFTIEHSFYGKIGNRVAIRPYALTRAAGAMPQKLMDQEKVYPYALQILKRPSDVDSPVLQETVSQARSVTFVVKPEAFDPDSGMAMDMHERLTTAWRDTSDRSRAPIYGEIGQVVVYQQNIDHICELIRAAEVTAGLLPHCDFSADASTKYLVNILGGTDSWGAPYKTLAWEEDVDAVHFDRYNYFYMTGGADGTMSTSALEAQLRLEFAKYADPNSYVQQEAVQVQNRLYDWGWQMATKEAALQFVAVRKDTLVSLATFMADDTEEEATDLEIIQSRLVSLAASAALYPESVYFQVGATRVSLHPGVMKIRNSRYRKYVPTLYEVLIKRCEYMGSSTGKWNEGKNYDGSPGSQLRYAEVVKPEFVNQSIVDDAWDNGAVYVQPLDRETYHIPVFRTVRSDDTSILTSDMAVQAIAHVHSLLQYVHRKHQGREGLTPDELSQLYNNDLADLFKDKFDGKYRLTPQAQFTSLDQQRGFSITVPVIFEGSVPSSVATVYVVARRFAEAG